MLCFNSFTVEAQESWTPTSGDQIGKTTTIGSVDMTLTSGWKYSSGVLTPGNNGSVKEGRSLSGDYVMIQPKVSGDLEIKGTSNTTGKYFFVLNSEFSYLFSKFIFFLYDSSKSGFGTTLVL